MYGIAFKARTKEYFAHSCVDNGYDIICFENKQDAINFLKTCNCGTTKYYVKPLSDEDKLESERYMNKKGDDKIGVLYVVSYKVGCITKILTDPCFRNTNILRLFKKKSDARKFASIFSHKTKLYTVEDIPKSCLKHAVKLKKEKPKNKKSINSSNVEYFIVDF